MDPLARLYASPLERRLSWTSSTAENLLTVAFISEQANHKGLIYLTGGKKAINLGL
jgi:hypothetical protein